MQLSIPGSEFVQDTFKHVRDLFGKSTEPESAQSPSQSLPPESSCQSDQFPLTHANPDVRPSVSASMRSSSQFKRSIVDKLFEGTYDSGFEIDDDDDDIREVSPPKRSTRTIVAASESDKPPRAKRTGAGRQTSPIEIEQESSAISSRYFQDPQPVEKPPLRTSRTMPSGRPGNNFISTGLKPVNTLTPTAVSSKQRHYLSNTRASSNHSGLSVAQAQPTPKSEPRPTPRSVEIYIRPPKRRKIESPGEEGGSHARDEEHSRPRSEHTVSIDPAASTDTWATAYGFEAPETRSTRQNGVRSTALRDLNLKRPVSKENQRMTRLGSPDQISSMANGDHDGEIFMRSARRERENRISDSDEERTHQGKQTSKKISRDRSSSTIGEDPVHAPKPSRPAPQTATPRISKMASRLDGGDASPDPLQSSAKTSAKPFRNFASPSRSPLLSSRAGKRFPLKRFICAALPVAEAKAYELEVDEQDRVFSIHYKDPDLTKDAIAGPITVSKIIKMTLPFDDAASIIILWFSDGVLLGQRCFLDFGDSRKTLVDFVGMIDSIDSGIRLAHRASTWIVSAMAPTNTNVREPKQAPMVRDKEVLESSQPVTIALHSREKPGDPQSVIRERRVDRLDAGPTGQTSHEKETRQTSRNVSSTNHQREAHAPQLTAVPSVERARETRSRVAKRPQEDTRHDTIPIDVEPRRAGPAWKKPLIYPLQGKSRATVTWEDLERLNDDEFLNDNLVALFTRYLQENMDPEHAKTMHFFSTFFYNALTRPAEKGKSRQINYSAVANWTKTVNLFKRDYVIVPVNEAAHWYVMIICNLRTLQEPQDEDVIEITGPVEENVNLVEDVSKTILESDITAERDSPEDSDYIEDPKTSAPASARKRSNKQKYQHLRQRKYSTNQPIIITLDSLDQPRSGTASALKSYLIEEAKDKYDLVVDKNDIKGMTAKNIPLQGNFSDCGLYLCMYLEQFIRDPKKFIRSILQREEEAFSWPKKLQNGVLRQRLYDMIQELHRAQAKKPVPELPKLPEIGRLLIKDEDYRTVKKTAQPSIYAPGNLNAGLDFAEKHLSEDNSRPSADRMLLEEVFPVRNENHTHKPEPQKFEATENCGSTSQPIVIEDSQKHTQDQDDTSSRYFQQRKEESDPPRANPRPDTPMELAVHLRERRSPRRSIIATPTTDATIDLTTPNGEPALGHNQRTEEIEERAARSQSCSTDYLTGGGTYTARNEPMQPSDGSTYVDGQDQDHPMPDTGSEFGGFPDEVIGEVAHSRDSSVVPESVQNTHSQDEMLLD